MKKHGVRAVILQSGESASLFFFLFVISLLPDKLFASNAFDDAALFELSLEELTRVQVITASSKQEKIANSPANIIVITKDEMRERGYLTLMDLMQDLPSVTWIGRYSAFNSQVIRGAYNSKRLLVLKNGLQFNPRNGFGVAWADRFPVEGIERVEFILGPYASLYGRNTFSGVLNIITQEAEACEGAQLSVVYGADNQIQGSTVIGTQSKDMKLFVSYFQNYSRNGIDLASEYPEYYSKESRESETLFGNPVVIPDSVSSDVILPWNNREFYLKLNHTSGFEFHFQQNYADLPKIGAGFTSLYYSVEKDNILNDNLINTSLRYNRAVGTLFSFNAAFTYQNFDWKAKNIYLDGSHRWYAQQSDSYILREQMRYCPTSWNELLLGISYERVEEKALISSAGNEPEWSDDDKYNKYYFNATLQDELILSNRFRLVLGLMFERSNVYDDVFIPRVSGIFNLDDANIIKVLYASSFLVPDPEVSVNQLDVLGTKSINPEYLNSYELNYIRMWNKDISTNASIFFNQTRDFIQQVARNNLPSGYSRTWENVGKSRAYGFDLSAKARILPSLKGFFSYSFVDGSIDDLVVNDMYTDVDRLPASAIQHFKAGINWRFWNDKLDLYIHDLFIGERYTWEDHKINGYQFANPGYKMDGYNIVDLNIKTTSSFNETWHFMVGVNNVFDKKAFDPTHSDYTVSSYTPIRRRWWVARMTLHF